MEKELEFFLSFGAMLNDAMINDLHEEKIEQKKAEKMGETKPQKKKKAKEPKPEKDQKVKTVTLQAASSESGEEPGVGEVQMYHSGSEGGSDDIEAGEEAPSLQFSKVHVPTHVDTKMNQKKGKNMYQKLREAAYREKLEAERPVESTWEKVKTAAAGGRVESSVAQIKNSIKKEKQQKRKKFEKKLEKAEQAKRKEKREAKKEFKGKKGKKKSTRPNFNKKK